MTHAPAALVAIGAIVFLAFALTACASQPTAPRVVTQRVEVPVPQPVKAPARLTECGRALPITEFGPVQDGSQYVLGLTEAEAEKLQSFADTIAGCLRAWRVWEMEQRVQAFIGESAE